MTLYVKESTGVDIDLLRVTFLDFKQTCIVKPGNGGGGVVGGPLLVDFEGKPRGHRTKPRFTRSFSR